MNLGPGAGGGQDEHEKSGPPKAVVVRLCVKEATKVMAVVRTCVKIGSSDGGGQDA